VAAVPGEAEESVNAELQLAMATSPSEAMRLVLAMVMESWRTDA